MNFPPCFRRHIGLVLLLVVYFGLTWSYSYVIPFSKGPDEYINYEYILFIAKQHRLPSTVAEKKEAGVKADWQPLYHIVGGIAASSVPQTSFPTLKVTWELSTRKLIDIVLPRATLIRTADERSPYRGEYAVWQMGRWVSMILGIGTLVATYFISMVVLSGQPIIATGTTALLVFTPRFLFTHAVLSDDTMLSFCLALYLLLLVHLARQSTGLEARFSDKHRLPVNCFLFVGLGVTAGLAIVTKFTAIPVIAGVFVSVGLIAYKQNWPWSTLLKDGLIFVSSLVVTVGWWISWVWWHFNQIDTLGPIMGLLKPLLPGATVDDNPTTARLTALLSGRFSADFGEAPGAGRNFIDWARQTFITFWGVTVFGAEPRWPYLYTIILGGVAVFCIAAAIGMWRVYRRANAAAKTMWQILTLHILIFFPLPMLRFALSGRLNDAAQGRHLLFPAGPAIVILLMIGWLTWFQSRWRNRVALLTGGIMLAWGVSHWAYLWGAYPPPLPVRTTSGPQIQVDHPAQANFSNVLQLKGYQTELLDDVSILKVDLLWESLAQAKEDYRTEITMIDNLGQPQLRWISQPADGRFPVRAWQPGDTVRDTINIPLLGLAPGDYKLQLRLLGWTGPFFSDQGEIVTLSTLALKNGKQSTKATLWQGKQIVAQQPIDSSTQAVNASLPTYRYRSTIPVTLSRPKKVSLVGLDGQARLPVTDVGYLRVFTVDYDWPSGNYQLYIDNAESGLGLQIANFDTRPGGWSFTRPEMTNAVQANFADKIELLGYDLPLRRAEAGGGIPLVLYWHGLVQMRDDYTMFVQLLDANQQRRGGYDRFPREDYNTYLWVPGEIVDDGFAVPVEADAPNGVYTIRIGFYEQKDGQIVSLPLIQNGQMLDETSVVIGPIKVNGPPSDVVVKEPFPETPLEVNLGDVIKLLGYDIKLEEAKIKLKLYWQSVNQTTVDYTSFVHIRSKTGEIVAQMDRPPVDGIYPTSLWNAGETILDEMMIPLPDNLSSGEYIVVIGLYDFTSGIRLSVDGSADDSIELSTIKILPTLD